MSAGFSSRSALSAAICLATAIAAASSQSRSISDRAGTKCNARRSRAHRVDRMGQREVHGGSSRAGLTELEALQSSAGGARLHAGRPE